MTRPRITYAILNAKWTILMNVILLVINFFSRTIFLSELGSSLVGLTSTMVSYIGFLNLMDLGIGTAINQALYKPISINDNNEIRRIISLIGYMFRIVGCAVGIFGIILSIFFPWIFNSQEVSLHNVYAAFYTYLLMTLMSYFINYRQSIFVAAQKSYIITKHYNIILVIKYLLQMLLLVTTSTGYIGWLVIEFSCQLFYVIWLEWRISKSYPWLKSSFKEGKDIKREYPSIFSNIKHIFSARIAGVGLSQSDNIIIQNMISLKDVTNYGNFSMITSRITRIITATFTTTFASVGNIIALNDHKKARLVFRQLTAMYFWIGSILAFGFSTFANAFVYNWLGNLGVEFSNLMVFIIAINMFISIVRVTFDCFLNGYGLFGDYYAAWSEFILNIVISVWLTLYYGLIGTIIGTTLSTFVIGIIWKPYYLYNRGFHDNVMKYYMVFLKYTILVGIGWLFTRYLCHSLIEESSIGWLAWFKSAAITTLIYSLISAIILYLFSSGMREFLKMIKDVINNDN